VRERTRCRHYSLASKRRTCSRRNGCSRVYANAGPFRSGRPRKSHTMVARPWRQVAATPARGVFCLKSKVTQGDADPNLIKTSKRFEEGKLPLDKQPPMGADGRGLRWTAVCRPPRNTHKVMPTLFSLRPLGLLRRERSRLICPGPMGSGRSPRPKAPPENLGVPGPPGAPCVHPGGPRAPGSLRGRAADGSPVCEAASWAQAVQAARSAAVREHLARVTRD
jgi:hypothetical protein